MKIRPLRVQLAQNVAKGKITEEIAKKDYVQNGFSVIPIRVGADFLAEKITEDDRIIREYVEVKSGNSQQSKKQKKKMREAKKEGISYTLYRISPQFLDNYLISISKKDHSFIIRGNTL